MRSLRDIAAALGPQKKTIELVDPETGIPLSIEVRGLSGADLGALTTRFPHEMAAMLDAARHQPGEGEDDSALRAEMMQMSQEFIPAIIAAGIGQLGNAEEEAFARTLPIETMILFMTAIMALTYPERPNSRPSEARAASS